MTLTQAQVAQLTAPFEAHEHRFISGNAYVDEYAVCQRLSQIDPSWEFVRIEESRTDIRAKVWMRLTIAGVTRDGVGMSPLTRKKRDGTIMDIDEPEKNAATDALRRAARLFGIGQYLLLLPKDDKGNPTVTNIAQMEGWLKRQFGVASQMPPKATQQAQGQAPAAQQDKTHTNATISDKTRDLLIAEVGKVTRKPSAERFNTVNKMRTEGLLLDTMMMDEMVALVLQRLETHEKQAS